jgi:hypothetical protein
LGGKYQWRALFTIGCCIDIGTALEQLRYIFDAAVRYGILRLGQARYSEQLSMLITYPKRTLTFRVLVSGPSLATAEHLSNSSGVIAPTGFEKQV